MSRTRRNAIAALSATALVGAAGFWLRGNVPTRDVDPAELAKASPLGDVVLGATDAPVTIIEYASMTCPHCAEFNRTVYPKLKAEYIDTGKVRFVFREFPFDLNAIAGAMLARGIGRDDPKKYHAVIDALFATQDDWMAKDTTERLRRIARQAGMSDDGFNSCLSDQRVLDGLQQCRNHAFEKLMVDVTPTFFVNGTRLVGALPIDEFRKLVDSNLKS